jgi:outer membrane protein TolC
LLLASCVNLAAQTGSVEPESLTLAQAIESTLRQHPLLRIQEEQVQYNRGALLRAQSQFDKVIQANGSTGRTYRPLSEAERTLYDTLSATTNLSSVDLSGTEQFRNGISATPLLSVARTTDNVATQNGLNQSHIAFQVNVPLLRGRGRDIVGAPEAAAGIEVDASLLDLNQTISDLIVNTVTSYWMAVAAGRTLNVYKDAERRGQTMLDTVRALVDADKIPRSDLNQALANLADRTSSRFAADQQYLQARQQLSLALGLDASRVLTRPAPMDPLPVASEAPSPPTGIEAMNEVISQALLKRADFLATKKRIREADCLAAAAKNQLKPQLDLQFTVGYSGLREGTRPDQFLISPVTGIRGVDVIGGIHYQFPLENRAAAGSVLQANSAVRQADFRRQDLARNIAAAVSVAMESIRNSARQLAAADESVRQFNTALDNEREKYRLGVGSLVDVLTVEDRLTGVLNNHVQAELGYAVAIARLRYATGAIVEPDKTAQNIDPGVFLKP